MRLGKYFGMYIVRSHYLHEQYNPFCPRPCTPRTVRVSASNAPVARRWCISHIYPLKEPHRWATIRKYTLNRIRSASPVPPKKAAQRPLA